MHGSFKSNAFFHLKNALEPTHIQCILSSKRMHWIQCIYIYIHTSNAFFALKECIGSLHVSMHPPTQSFHHPNPRSDRGNPAS